MAPRLKVQERKLGRENALGLAWKGSGLIELDPRLKGRQRLEVLVHESLHHLFIDASEETVDATGRKIAALLWAQGYRRVDVHDKPKDRI